jgi:transposase
MKIAILGIDLGKNSCSLVGLDGQGKVVKRRRMWPASIVGFTKSLPPPCDEASRKAGCGKSACPV